MNKKRVLTVGGRLQLNSSKAENTLQKSWQTVKKKEKTK